MMRGWVLMGLAVVGCVAPERGLDPGDPAAASGADDAGQSGDDLRDAAIARDAADQRPDVERAPLDGGGPRINTFVACPSDDQRAPPAGTDTRVRVDFASRYSRGAEEPLQLFCDGRPIAGAIRFAPTSIELTPASLLPANSRCEMVVATSVRGIDGVSLGGRSTFTVGDRDQRQLRVEPRQQLADAAFTAVPATSDEDALLYGLFHAGGLSLAITPDSGRSFVSSVEAPANLPANFRSPSFSSSAGVVHAAWASNGQYANGIAYARLTDFDVGFSAGVMLQPRTPVRSVAVIARGREVSIVWVDTRDLSEFRLTRRYSSDGGDTFGPAHPLAMGDRPLASIPYAVESNPSGAYLALVAPNAEGSLVLQLLRLGPTPELVMELQGWPVDGNVVIDRVDDRRFLLQSPFTSLTYFAVVDVDGRVDIPVRVAPGNTVRLTPAGDVIAIAPTQTWRSRDRGLTFEDPTTILQLGRRIGAPWPASIRSTADGALLFAWDGNHAARAEFRSQCQL